jgi:hypothetical protein
MHFLPHSIDLADEITEKPIRKTGKSSYQAYWRRTRQQYHAEVLFAMAWVQRQNSSGFYRSNTMDMGSVGSGGK